MGVMTRIILIYGMISGLVIILAIIGTTRLPDASSMWLGYLVMLIALSSILVGVKQHRDRDLGGVISFRTALLAGLGIAGVASLTYVVIWEIYLALTGYGYMDQFVASTLAARRATGMSEADYANLVADMDAMRRQYANPLFRLPMTFTEIFPVGLLVALASAELLRNPRFLPARTAV